VRLLLDYLFREGVVTAAEVEQLETEVTQHIDDAVRYAEESAPASPEGAFDDLFAR
jgi:TPP-dependent pyruvate/acetoin dehydrogenase alpha subunit